MAISLPQHTRRAEYKIGKHDGKDTIYNLNYKDHPKNDNALWSIDGLPDNG